MRAPTTARQVCRPHVYRGLATDPKQLDIEGLNITVVSGGGAGAGEKPVKAKGKGKAAAEGTEILSNAKLRLKAGSRYALVGRNGSGKSSKHANRTR